MQILVYILRLRKVLDDPFAVFIIKTPLFQLKDGP